MPVIVDRSVREKVTKGRAGMRWVRVAERMWKDIGRNQEEAVSVDKFGRYKRKTDVEEMVERRERLALGYKLKSEKHVKMYGGTSEGIGMKTHLHGPMDFAKTLEHAISCRGPGPARKKRYTRS